MFSTVSEMLKLSSEVGTKEVDSTSEMVEVEGPSEANG